MKGINKILFFSLLASISVFFINSILAACLFGFILTILTVVNIIEFKERHSQETIDITKEIANYKKTTDEAIMKIFKDIRDLTQRINYKDNE